MIGKIMRTINSEITLYDNGWCFRVNQIGDRGKVLLDGRDVIIWILCILLVIN